MSSIIILTVAVVVSSYLLMTSRHISYAQTPDTPDNNQLDGDNIEMDENDVADVLSAGAGAIIGQLKPGFTCDKKVYGYYADTINDCKVFHVCWPIKNEYGATINKEWTFVCGNGTLFNQERLICDRPDNVDCSKAESFYDINKEFGQTTPIA